MGAARFIVATVFDGLASLEPGSVDLILTSPPFLSLRSYLPADHPDKAREIGSEPTPGEFIDTLIEVTEELARVLAPHGSLVIELGDTYSGSGGAGGDYGEGGLREGQPKFKTLRRKDTGAPGWPSGKSLTMIPELYRVALAYGQNPLTGRITPPWRVRNVVRWCRPNPPVGALADKFRPATSDLVIACKSRTRFFDLDAVRGPGGENTHPRTAKGVESRPATGKTAAPERGGNFATLDTLHETEGAPPLDTWVIPTAPFKGSHYATFPPELCVKPILAMCPESVCLRCGEPRRRIAETSNAIGEGFYRNRQPGNERAMGGARPPSAQRETLGWTDCGHGQWRRGVVLDPFAGSGTTLAVATGHGRDAIGFDIDERNAELARQRVGMFLQIDHPEWVA